MEYLEWIRKNIPKRRVWDVPWVERGGTDGMDLEWEMECGMEWNLERERSIVEN